MSADTYTIALRVCMLIAVCLIFSLPIICVVYVIVVVRPQLIQFIHEWRIEQMVGPPPYGDQESLIVVVGQDEDADRHHSEAGGAGGVGESSGGIRIVQQKGKGDKKQNTKDSVMKRDDKETKRGDGTGPAPGAVPGRWRWMI